MHTNPNHPKPTQIGRSRRTSIFLSVTAVAGLALGATGCGKSPSEFVAEKVIEQQTDGEVDVDFSDGGISIDTPDGDMTVGEDGSFTVTGEDGESVIGESDEEGNFTIEGDDGSFSLNQDGEIPEEWPSEIPRPDGITVAASSVMDTGDGAAITVTGTVEDGPAFVAQYGAALESAGLDKSSEFSSADTVTVMYGDESWAMSVGSNQYDGEHQVSITLYPQA